MATLNQAPFDRSPFNLGQTNTVVWVNVEMNEFVDRMIGFSKEVFLYPVMNEKVKKIVSPTKTIMRLSIEGRELVGYLTDLIGQFWITQDFNESISSVCSPTSYIWLNLDANEYQSSEISPGRDYRFSYDVEMIEEIGFEHVPYFEIWLDEDIIELVSQTTSVVATEEFACVIDVTLHPGDVLIIDSNNYNVLLNGENIVDKHTGDWLDALNRNTTAISFQAASGNANLSGSVLYTERNL